MAWQECCANKHSVNVHYYSIYYTNNTITRKKNNQEKKRKQTRKMENLYTRGRDRVKPRGANQRQNYKKA